MGEEGGRNWEKSLTARIAELFVRRLERSPAIDGLVRRVAVGAWRLRAVGIKEFAVSEFAAAEVHRHGVVGPEDLFAACLDGRARRGPGSLLGCRGEDAATKVDFRLQWLGGEFPMDDHLGDVEMTKQQTTKKQRTRPP